MWNETPEVVAVREALGLFSSHLLIVSPARGLRAMAPAQEEPKLGLIFVFDHVCVFDPSPISTLVSPNDRDVSDERINLCRWFSDSTTSVAFADGGFSILVGDVPSFRFFDVDCYLAVFNALHYIFHHPRGLSAVQHSPMNISAVMFPEATKRLDHLKRVKKKKLSAASHADNAERDKKELENEFVVADLEGCLVTNVRIFFSTSTYFIRDIAFMIQSGPVIILTLEKTLRLQISCTPFRQSILLRKWLLCVLEHHSVDMTASRESPELLTMIALHRQFCAVACDGSGSIDRPQFEKIVAPIFTSPQFSSSFFQIMDSDRDEEISFPEFACGLMDLLSDNITVRTKFTFAMFDVNRDGAIEPQEMIEVMSSLQHTGDVLCGNPNDLQDMCLDLFQMLDHDGDGFMTFEEFQAGFERPEVYNLLCHLGLAGDRSVKLMRVKELSVCLTTSKDRDWVLLAGVLHTLKLMIEIISTERDDFADIEFIETTSVQLQDRRSLKFEKISPAFEKFTQGVVLHHVKAFQRVHQRLGISGSALEFDLGTTNIAASLLLGNPRLLRKVHHRRYNAAAVEPLIEYVSFDGVYSVVAVPQRLVQQLVDAIPSYVEHVLLHPNHFLQNIIGLATIVSFKKGLTLCVLQNRSLHRPRVKLEAPWEALARPRKIFLDPGWCDIALAQMELDLKFLQMHQFGLRVCITSAMDLDELTKLPPQPKTILGQQLHPQKDEEKGKGDDSGGGCCSSIKIKEPVKRKFKQNRLGPVQEEKEQEEELVTSVKALAPISVGGKPIHISIHFVLHNHTKERSDSATLLSQLSEVFSPSPADVLPTPAAGVQCEAYPVIMFNGREGVLTLDKGARILYLLNRSDVTLFSISLRISFGLSFVRHKFPKTHAQRQQLHIRAEPEGDRYKIDKVVQFKSVAALENFTSDVHRGTGSNQAGGMQLGSLKVYCVHWNVGATNPPPSLVDLFERIEDGQLICVSASRCVFQTPGRPVTQSCEDDWKGRVLSVIGEEFQIVTVASIGATRLLIAARRIIFHRISNLSVWRKAIVSQSGQASSAGICISFQYDNSKFAVFGVDLVPQTFADPAEARDTARVAEKSQRQSEKLEELIRSLTLIAGLPLDILSCHHHVFIMGDFNFGAKGSHHETVALASNRDYPQLRQNDFLSREVRAGRALFGFKEPRMNFPPTSYFVNNTTPEIGRIYNEWADFPPSWASRIFYKSLGHSFDNALLVEYDSIDSIRTSPHNAIFASYDLPIRQQYVLMNLLHEPCTCVKLVITDLRCEGLAAEDRSGTSDPMITFHSHFISPNSTTLRTEVMPGTLNPRWIGQTYDLLLEPIEHELLKSEYLVFIVEDVDARGCDSLGQAVVDLSFQEGYRKSVDAPIVRYGKRCGTLRANLRLVTV